MVVDPKAYVPLRGLFVVSVLLVFAGFCAMAGGDQ